MRLNKIILFLFIIFFSCDESTKYDVIIIGGGAGGTSNQNASGTAGTANTGGGAGGSSTANNGTPVAGANGGSGVVIIRYKFG